MTLAEAREAARAKFKGVCRVCRVCDGAACRGEVPGFGGVGSGQSFINNVEALARIKVNLRTMHGCSQPDTSFSLFGRTLKFPILGAPVGGVKINRMGDVTERELAGAMLEGPVLAGTIGMGGDGGNPEVYDAVLEAIGRLKGFGIAVVKPREKEEVIRKIRMAEEVGAFAVGMDVDAAAFINMALVGQKVEPKPVEELAELVRCTRLPFIVKGVMTADEAEGAVEAGAAGIVVSNHGGRVLDHTPGTAEVLPEIAERVKGKTVIFVDGGIRSGVDVLKALALGADAVLVGRPLTIAAVGGGVEAVKLQVEALGRELFQAMILTGCATLKEIGPRVIRVHNG